MIYPITPCPAPRMTQSDRWKKRPCVQRYFQFRDLVKWFKVTIPESGAEITFYMPMPESWPRSKWCRQYGKPHQQKPDLDNLIKALLDAVFDEDCRIWQYQAKKIWSDNGAISIVANGEDQG